MPSHSVSSPQSPSETGTEAAQFFKEALTEAPGDVTTRPLCEVADRPAVAAGNRAQRQPGRGRPALRQHERPAASARRRPVTTDLQPVSLLQPAQNLALPPMPTATSSHDAVRGREPHKRGDERLR